MKKICNMCNGTGQISYFKGVSRFLLSEEECPECQGLGFSLMEDEEEHPEENDKGQPGPKSDDANKKRA